MRRLQVIRTRALQDHCPLLVDVSISLAAIGGASARQATTPMHLQGHLNPNDGHRHSGIGSKARIITATNPDSRTVGRMELKPRDFSPFDPLRARLQGNGTGTEGRTYLDTAEQSDKEKWMDTLQQTGNEGGLATTPISYENALVTHLAARRQDADIPIPKDLKMRREVTRDLKRIRAYLSRVPERPLFPERVAPTEAWLQLLTPHILAQRSPPMRRSTRTARRPGPGNIHEHVHDVSAKGPANNLDATQLASQPMAHNVGKK